MLSRLSVPVVLLLVVGVLLAGGSLAGSSAGTTRPAVAGAAGIGDPYFPEDGNGGIDVRSYDVHDRYRFSDGRLTGWTTVRLHTTERLRSFDLDFLLPVSKVTLSTGGAGFDRPDRHELRITPGHPIAAGTDLAVRLEYAGRPARLSWDGESNWLASGHEVVAMNEPHMAPWWFPSNDHPLDKARFDLHLTVPRGKRVVSNGRQVGVRRTGDHATYHWAGGGPMATYLAFFAVGDFAVRRGTAHHLPYEVAVSRRLGAGARRSAMRGLLRTPDIVAWLQSQLGRYPFKVTGGLVTSLDPGFSLENQTRPTYPRGVSGSLMVHELAHQWFGDSVSVHHWRDVWLNEGFATFMEQLWTADHGGPSTRSWLQQTYGVWPQDSSFWKLIVADPGAAHLFAWPVYERGGMTLAALRVRIGHDAFARLLRHWTRAHRHGHGTTAQFEAMASRVGGVDLTSFFDAWVHSDTRPAHTAENGL
ncbi:MAG TPA: M1 family metallopeptidase [Nocardioides sp.]|nr:M1 family metallopeptidase [Nocardioides sp.]